jgi:hypothetical protein
MAFVLVWPPKKVVKSSLAAEPKAEPVCPPDLLSYNGWLSMPLAGGKF